MTPLAATEADVYADFITWATDHLGQGYSLATEEGSFIDPVTRWAFVAFKAGLKRAPDRAPSTEPDLDDVLSAVLWLYHRLPRGYERQAHIERVVTSLANATRSDGVLLLRELGREGAPSTDSAADARDAALWRNLIDDTNAQPCAYKCLRDDLGDWIRERAGVQTVGKDTERLDFIQSHPEIRLIYRKNRWGFVGCTNYEYEVFKTVREAIDAAIAASLPQTKEE